MSAVHQPLNGRKKPGEETLLGFTETDLADLISYYEEINAPIGGPEPMPSDPELNDILLLSDQFLTGSYEQESDAVPSFAPVPVIQAPLSPASAASTVSNPVSPASACSAQSIQSSPAARVSGVPGSTHGVPVSLLHGTGASARLAPTQQITNNQAAYFAPRAASLSGVLASQYNARQLEGYPDLLLSSIQSSVPPNLAANGVANGNPFFTDNIPATPAGALSMSHATFATPVGPTVQASQPVLPQPAPSATLSAALFPQTSAGSVNMFTPAPGVPPMFGMSTASFFAGPTPGSVPARSATNEEISSLPSTTASGSPTRSMPAPKSDSESCSKDCKNMGGSVKKGSHSEVERKRRDLINERITQLKHLVPDLAAAAPNKAMILGRAVDHMNDLLDDNRRLMREKDELEKELLKLKDLSLKDTGSPDNADSPPMYGEDQRSRRRYMRRVADDPDTMGEISGGGDYYGEQRYKRASNVLAPQALQVPHLSLKQFIASALKLAMENLILTDPSRLGHPIVYASQGFQKMTGYPSDEIIGRNCRFLQGQGTDSNTITQIGKAIRDGREYLTEVLNYRKDGTPFWNLVYITPVEDSTGTTSNYIGVQFDITSNNIVSGLSPPNGAMEESPRVEMLSGPPDSRMVKKTRGDDQGMRFLTQSLPNQGLKQLLASILHLSMSNLIVTDPRRPDNPIVYASEGFQNLTGYSKHEIIGRNCRFLQGPKSDPNTILAMSRGLRQKQPFLAEVLNYKKDGTPFWNLVFITPVLDNHGEAVKFIGVQLDVTDHH
uniref:Putative LOV domain-containing protein n=1 Tax=Glaucocystis sp. BC-2016 TaxID=1802912 RepID=A0A126X0L1_9EUKA|nr:putative LOV domain-containing protein [Glaucocystis sp. BC-2016]